MKVLFDHQTFILQQYGGISRYFANLYHGFSDLSDLECNLSLLYSENYYLGSQSMLPSSIGKRFLKKRKRLDKWNKRYSEYILKKNDYDIFHPTYYDPYFLKTIKKPFVITVHDMIHELYPEWFAPYDCFVQYKRLVIEKADHFIAISHATKSDLQAVYGIDDSKISVVHHGYSPNTETARLNIPFDTYILFVGDRATYKNFNRFVTAMQQVISGYPDVAIICAGGGEFSIPERELFRRKGLKNIVQLSVSDSELNALYQKAVAFVYPSLCEGFGIPILEAFGNNCPVIASNITCFTEVGDQACIYFDPYNAEDMAQKIIHLIESDETRLKLFRAGKSRLDEFTMEACVNKTYNTYRKLL